MAEHGTRDRDRIFVGIDFGTTFSGAAWAYSGDPDSIEIVTNWEAEYSHCRDVEKTPSRLYYNRNNIVSCWGNGAKGRKGAKPISWFKLLLLDDEDVPSDIAASYQFREAKKLQQAMGKNAVELAGDYLRKIWEHTLLSIERAVGRELMGQCSFHVTITVPAVWPPYAHHRVRKAISYAGIPTLRDGRNVSFGLITEPEAAALATIKDMGKRSNVKVEDIIVLCDAGGGTVDLISYVVDGLDPFSVSECVRGSGALGGGIFLDEAFLNMVQLKLKEKTTLSLDGEHKDAFLNDAWEHGLKTQFENQERSWSIDVPSNALSGIGKRPRSLTMSRHDMFHIFDPKFVKVEDLVRDQLQAVRTMFGREVKYVVLVGGLGRNAYLFKRLAALVHNSTTILQTS